MRKAAHGIVLAKSIPAKKYGIQTAEPVASALRKCPGLVVEKPDHTMYRRYSRAMMELLSGYTPDLEQVSIDECYLDFTPIAHLYPSPEEAAARIRDHIFETFGFTVNVGISNVKVLAKMASDFEKPGKVHTLYRRNPLKMWPLPVSDLFWWPQKRRAPEDLRHPHHRRPGPYRPLFSHRPFQKPRKAHVGICQRHRSLPCGVQPAGGQRRG